MFRGQHIVFAFLALSIAFAGLASAIEPAGNWGFGPCAVQHNTTNGMRYNQCFSPSPDIYTQGRYCDSKGSYIYNCSDSCPCMDGYFCSPTGTCDFCSGGETCFTVQESALDTAMTDFMGFMPTMLPLLLAFALGLLAFWLLELLRHLDEYQ